MRHGSGAVRPQESAARRDQRIGIAGVLGCAIAVVLAVSVTSGPPPARREPSGLDVQPVDSSAMRIGYGERRVRMRLASDSTARLLRTERSAVHITLGRLVLTSGGARPTEKTLAWVVELDHIQRAAEQAHATCEYFMAYAADDGRELLARRFCH